MWYPEIKSVLEKEVDEFLSQKIIKKPKEIHGLIVPHAGYPFSGKIAGKAFSLLKNKKTENAVLLGPSHYAALRGVLTSNKKEWYTPLGEISIFNEKFDEGEIEKEHSINNQLPFLQSLGIKKILPLMVGDLTDEHAKKIAEKIANIPALFIFSTDLSHFLPYESAIKKDKETIKIIESLDLENFSKVDACGFFPLLILMHLCKIKSWKPKLIEYKNSGDITGDKTSVVGYSSFYF